MKASVDSSSNAPTKDAGAEVLYSVRRHLRLGWWSLLGFLTLGLVLEALHARKAGLYLDVSNSTRRLMWTLAHAHGTLLALVHLAFAATVHFLPTWNMRSRSLASTCLTSASLLIPIGFFLGGIVIYGGDPGLGIVLVPAGAMLLFGAVFLTARAATASSTRIEKGSAAKKIRP
jgi:hypothetical protein